MNVSLVKQKLMGNILVSHPFILPVTAGVILEQLSGPPCRFSGEKGMGKNLLVLFTALYSFREKMELSDCNSAQVLCQ
jgi:hypothetical protein